MSVTLKRRYNTLGVCQCRIDHKWLEGSTPIAKLISY